MKDKILEEWYKLREEFSTIDNIFYKDKREISKREMSEWLDLVSDFKKRFNIILTESHKFLINR